MCLSVPTRVLEIKGDMGVVEIGGVKREVSLLFVKNTVNLGEYVLVHAGFAIQKVDEDEAKETLALFDEISKEYDKG